MFPMIECDARVLVNGDLIADRVSVGIDPKGNYLYLKVIGTRKDLFLRPFMAQTITQWDANHMKAGAVVNLAGPNVGSWSYGPLGHPGDGEFEKRSVTSAEVHIGYSPARIVITINGNTDLGRATYKGDQPDPHHNSPLPKWAFELEFSVPKTELKQFLPIEQINYNSFEERLNECV